MSHDPILAALARLEAGQARLEAGQDRLEARQAGFEARQAGFEARHAGFEARQAGFEARHAGFEAGQARLEARLARLETAQERLEAGQERLEAAQANSATRAELHEMRIAVMERIDRLQNMVTAIRDDIAVNMGAVDAMQRANDNTRELVRSQGEQLNIMWRQLKSLEAKVREITGDPMSDVPDKQARACSRRIASRRRQLESGYRTFDGIG